MRSWSRQARPAWAVALLFLVLVGCAEKSGTATADCTNQVRYDGRLYDHYAFTTRDATLLGPADRASCDDTSEDARGSYYPEDPEQVEVLTIDGYSSDEVLGVGTPGGQLQVYFAESLSSADIDRISGELGSD